MIARPWSRSLAIRSNSVWTSDRPEAARRLVEHEQSTAGDQRPRDLDQLLAGWRKFARGNLDRNLRMAQLSEGADGRLTDASRSDDLQRPEPGRLDAQRMLSITLRCGASVSS